MNNRKNRAVSLAPEDQMSCYHHIISYLYCSGLSGLSDSAKRRIFGTKVCFALKIRSCLTSAPLPGHTPQKRTSLSFKSMNLMDILTPQQFKIIQAIHAPGMLEVDLMPRAMQENHPDRPEGFCFFRLQGPQCCTPCQCRFLRLVGGW